MGLARFAAELCAYLGKLKCASYMRHEFLGFVNKFVSIIYDEQLWLKQVTRSILQDCTRPCISGV